MNGLYADTLEESFVFDGKVLQEAIRKIYGKDFNTLTDIPGSMNEAPFRTITHSIGNCVITMPSLLHSRRIAFKTTSPPSFRMKTGS